MEKQLSFYAPPLYPRSTIEHTEFHKEMINVAFPDRGEIEKRRWRVRSISKFRIQKIWFFLLKKNFFTRLANYIVYKRSAYKKARVHYLPPSVQIESSTGCQLKCPGCLIGTKNETGFPGKISFTTISTFKKEIDLIYKKCFQLYFHMHAEPLLNEDFFEACRYACDKGLWTGIHTNLVPTVKNLPEKLIACGLCNLVISIDGATQATYELYRKGGHLDVVLKKMNSIALFKKNSKSRFPVITAKFLVFEHNWHEIKMFKEIALSNGADEVVFVTGYANGMYSTGKACTEYEFNLNELAWKPFKLPDICPYLWDDLRIDTDGGLFGCGNGYNKNHAFFSYANEKDNISMQEQFNSDKFVAMRNYFLKHIVPEKIPAPCSECSLVKRLQDVLAK